MVYKTLLGKKFAHAGQETLNPTVSLFNVCWWRGNQRIFSLVKVSAYAKKEIKKQKKSGTSKSKKVVLCTPALSLPNFAPLQTCPCLSHFQLHEEILVLCKPDETSSISPMSAPVIQHCLLDKHDTMLLSLLKNAERHQNQVYVVTVVCTQFINCGRKDISMD